VSALPDIPDFSELSSRISDLSERLTDLPDALPERLRVVAAPVASLGKASRARSRRARRRRVLVPLAAALAVAAGVLVARAVWSGPKPDPMEPEMAADRPDIAVSLSS